MQMVDLKRSTIIDTTPHLLNSLARSVNPSSNRKYSKIPFN